MEELYSEILTKLRLDLQEQVERFDDESAIDWSFVKVNLGKLLRLRKYAGHFSEIFKFLMDCFDSYEIRDLSVIADVLQLAFFVSDYHRTSHSYAQILVRHMRENIPRTHKLYHRHVYKLMRMPFTNKPTEHSYQLDVVWTAASHGHEYFVSRLLQYGVMYIPSTNYTWNYCLSVLEIFLKAHVKPFFTTAHLSYHLKNWNSGQTRLFTIFRALEILGRSQGVPYLFSLPPYQRPQRGWSQLSSEYSTDSLQYIRCFRYIFDTIPESFITTREIRTIFERIMTGTAFEAVVSRICCNFEQCFPESAEPLTPRTLKHISRCKVRDIFRIAGTFPHGVEDLKLLPHFENYILLREMTDSSSAAA